MVRSKIVNMATATSLAALSFAIPQTPVYAQTDPVVDVCTGLSLNQSDLTALLGEVNTGIVTPVQGTVNGLLGVCNYGSRLVVDFALTSRDGESESS